jgi:hypothetical protein
MVNPGGNYPGRQIMMGGLINGLPAFIYFGSGRSKPSKERYVQDEADGLAYRMKPLNSQESFDRFRHYEAVLVDPKTGLLVVSNSQSPDDAVFMEYMYMTEEEKITGDWLRSLMEVIGPEPDNRTIDDSGNVSIDESKDPTPRVIAVMFRLRSGKYMFTPVFTPRKGFAYGLTEEVEYDGELKFKQTYDGSVDPYRPFDYRRASRERNNVFRTRATTVLELVNEVHECSSYVDPKFGELGSWTLGGVLNGNGPGGWDMAVRDKKRPDAAVRLFT